MQLIQPEKRPDKKKLESLPIVGDKPKSEKEEKWLKEMSTFEFYNLEEPGLNQKFTYGSTSNNATFEFFHGGKYVIPRHVASWLENRSTPMYAYRPNGTGQMEKTPTGVKPRFQMRQVMSA